MGVRACEGQMELGLSLASGTPGSCPHEGDTVATGSQTMSLCSLMAAWTNCREMHECVYDFWRSEKR